MAAFAPIPSASVSTATAVKPGFLRNIRAPKRISCRNDSSIVLPQDCKPDYWTRELGSSHAQTGWVSKDFGKGRTLLIKQYRQVARGIAHRNHRNQTLCAHAYHGKIV